MTDFDIFHDSSSVILLTKINDLDRCQRKQKFFLATVVQKKCVKNMPETSGIPRCCVRKTEWFLFYYLVDMKRYLPLQSMVGIGILKSSYCWDLSFLDVLVVFYSIIQDFGCDFHSFENSLCHLRYSLLLNTVKFNARMQPKINHILCTRGRRGEEPKRSVPLRVQVKGFFIAENLHI